jgi:hypothetical protein
MRLSSAGQYPCGPHAGIQDRDRRPCEGIPEASTARLAVSVRTASPACVKRHGGRGRAFGRCAIIELDVGIFVNAIFKRPNAPQNLLVSSTPSPKSFYGLIVIAILYSWIPVATCASATLEDFVSDFVQRIASHVDSKADVSVEMLNDNSLSSANFERVKLAVATDLAARGIHSAVASLAPDAPTKIIITFSANLSGLIWAAEIRHGDSDQFVLFPVSREWQNPAGSGGTDLVLHAEKFWEGPERILDAAQLNPPNGSPILLLLLPGRLLVRSGDTTREISLPSEMAHTNLRTMRGRIANGSPDLDTGTNPAVWAFQGQYGCMTFPETGGLRQCQTASVPDEPREPSPMPNFGNQTAQIESACRPAGQILATGTGDYAQADTIQAFDELSGVPVASSNVLDFPGPVLELHKFIDVYAAPNRTAITAIVHNLESSNYEAYHISATCGQ